MSNTKLSLRHRPENGVRFTKRIRIGKNYVYWTVTKEANAFLVWRGHCLDSEPWEESDWAWEIRSAWSDRDEAIEVALVAATEEEGRSAG